MSVEEKKVKINQSLILSKDIKGLCNHSSSSDVTFEVLEGKVKKEKPTKFYGHKLILGSRSTYLKKMFDEQKKSKTFKFDKMNPSAFHEVFTYIYTGSCTLKQEYMMDLLHISSLFELTRLTNSTCDFILKGLTPSTVVKFIMDVKSPKYSFDTKYLISKCVEFMEENDVDVIHNKSYEDFDEETFIFFLKSDKFSIDESELFNAVMKWGNKNRKNNEKLSEVVKNIVPHLRYPLMTIDFLMDTVKNHEAVPVDLYLKGLEYHIVSDGPFDMTDPHYKIRSSPKKIVFDPPMKNKLNFKLTNGGLTCEKVKGGNAWDSGIIFGDKGFNSGVLYWEIQILHLNHDRSGMCIGITNNRSTSTYNKDIGIGMSGNRHNCYISSGSGSSARSSVKDRIGILLDFNKKKVFFFRNGNYLKLTATIYSGNTYFPVVHLFYPKDKVQVSMKEEKDFPKGDFY